MVANICGDDTPTNYSEASKESVRAMEMPSLMSEDDLQRGRIQWLEGHAAGIKEAEERIAKAEQQQKELYRLRGDLFELRDVVTGENFAEMQKRAESAEQQIQAQREELAQW